MEKIKWAILIAGGCALIGLGTLAYTAEVAQEKPPEAKVVRAEKFELVDSKGKVRGAFSTGIDGNAELSLFGKQGKERAVLTLDATGPTISLKDDDGELRARLTLVAGGSPVLYLSEKDKKATAILALERGRPFLSMRDQGGNMRTWSTR